jgi:hypothetical protein
MKPTTFEERIEFLTENYEQIHTNCAKALILSELGFSSNGIAKKLGVTTGTAKKYLRQLENSIGKGVTETMPKQGSYATYPGDEPNNEPIRSDEVIDLSPQFKDRECGINRGCEIEDIDKRLIHVTTE